MNRLLLPLLALPLAISSASCSCSNTEKSESVAAEQEALQDIDEAGEIDAADDIERARIEGRNAAKEFVGKQWPDTMSIQAALLEARSRRSSYIIRKNPQAAEAFDSAFVSTIRTVRPDVGRHLAPLDANAE